MPYIRKTVIAGGLVVEVTKTFASRYGQKGVKRAAHEKPTPEKQDKVNEIKAETKLRHQMAANFKPGDWHNVLTFKKSMRPQSYEELQECMRWFIAEVRKHFRNVLGKVFKYIYTLSFGETNPHVHLMIEGVDIRAITDIWRRFGTLRATAINNIHHLLSLPAYFLKHTKGDLRPGRYTRRWVVSMNLEKPVINIEVMGADKWHEKVRPRKGYYLRKDSNGRTVHNYTSAINGLPCQFYMLLRAGGEDDPDENYNFDYEDLAC